MVIIKRKIIFIVAIVLIVAGGIRWYMEYQNKKEIKADTISHLTDQGYDTNKDLKDIYVVDMGLNQVIYAVVVTFKDEPQVDYFYSYEQETKQIIQINFISNKTSRLLKHQEKNQHIE